MSDLEGRHYTGMPGGSAALLLIFGALAVVLVGTRLVRFSSDRGEMVVASFAIDPAGADTLAVLLTQGQQVYQGRSGGALCATCHGPHAKGIAGIGPDLTDGAWLHGDGSMEFLRAIIRSGVSKPKTTSAVMPPFGGSPLKPDQLEAVAAYVHSLSSSGR